MAKAIGKVSEVGVSIDNEGKPYLVKILFEREERTFQQFLITNINAFTDFMRKMNYTSSDDLIDEVFFLYLSHDVNPVITKIQPAFMTNVTLSRK